MDIPEIVEHFFGVYLLYCKDPRHKGKTYIGYTVNPKRRLKQHNAGKKFGGAWKTSNKGPWIMVLVVHGFPNSTSALRFEWAWQHPEISRRLKHLPKKKRTGKQTAFQYRLAILSEMLKVGPWDRLPLTIRWLDYEFSVNHSNEVSPPMHMPISYGQVESRSLKNKNRKEKTPKVTVESEDDSMILCSLCYTDVNKKDKVTCVKADCDMTAHLICLAKKFNKDDKLLPIAGECPSCNTDVLWGDLIRKKIGCNLHLNSNDVADNESDDDSDSSSD